MKIYIAGPMSGLPDLNFPAFHEAAKKLRDAGYTVVNPAEINSDPSSGWLECMRADIAQLVTCDGVAYLPDWERSRGAKIEIALAMKLGFLVASVETLTALSVVMA